MTDVIYDLQSLKYYLSFAEKVCQTQLYNIGLALSCKRVLYPAIILKLASIFSSVFLFFSFFFTGVYWLYDVVLVSAVQ